MKCILVNWIELAKEQTFCHLFLLIPNLNVCVFILMLNIRRWLQEVAKTLLPLDIEPVYYYYRS